MDPSPPQQASTQTNETTKPPPPPPPPVSPTLRLATPQDAQAIATLASRVFSAAFGSVHTHEDLDAHLTHNYSLPRITAELSNPQIHFIVAVTAASASTDASASDTIVGFAQLTEGTSDPCIAHLPRPVELQRLYVDLAQHGTGLARALVEEVQGIAVARGYESLWLGVWEENGKAQRFYGKMGFERAGEHDFPLGSVVETDWIMSKSLVGGAGE